MRGVGVLVLVGLFAAVACTKRNPEVCCNTAVECDHFGFDDITPCEGFQVCVDGSCQAPTCTTSADCADPTPYCANTVCVAACAGDETCVGAGAGPYCSADGDCVDCLENGQCDASAPVCDAAAHACRGCVEDAECASGICLAALGTCADEVDAVFVTNAGADAGDCPAAAPCATVAYALTKITTVRHVLRIPGSDFVEDAGVVIDRDVYVDAANTRFQRGADTGPIILVDNNASVTLEGVRIVGIAGNPGLDVTGGAKVTAYRLVLDPGNANVHGGSSELHVVRASINDRTLSCSDLALLEVRDSELVTGSVDSITCDTTVVRSHLRALDSWSVHINQLLPVRIENNVFEADASRQGDFFSVFSSYGVPSQEAVIRYNTFINTNPTASSTLMDCGGGMATPVFSSNLVLAHSPNVISLPSTCVVDHSLFDDATGTPPGTANLSAPPTELVTDYAGADYRPPAGSPALGAGDPAQAPAVDFAGNPRPLPAGSNPDIGAFELP